MPAPPPDAYPFDVTAHVFRWARLTPNKAAIVHNGQALSYRLLAGRVAAARAALAGAGVSGPGVAMLPAYEAPDFWVVCLALRSLGVTTLAAPSLKSIEKLSPPDLRWVVANPARHWAGLPEACARAGARLVWRQADEIADPADVDPQVYPGGHILLSSGTTGFHKMVLMAPSFEGSLIANRIRITELTQNSVVSMFNYPSWTRAGYQAPLAAFVLGATVLAEEQDFRRVLAYTGLTHAIILPPMTGGLLAAMPEGAGPLRGLRIISVAGSLTRQQAAAIRTHISPNLFNGLACTETNTIGDTRIETDDDLRWHRLVPDFDVQVVDDVDRPAPIGQTGRLRVAVRDSPGGYLNDEQATRDHFRHGYFYTGDLAAFREDGRLALQGRVTDVINIGGVKTSPLQIEDRLMDALPVTGVCLFSMPNDAGEEELHVVLETTTPVATEVLTPVLRQALWGFPLARVHFVSNAPRNDMGKIVRRDLRIKVLGR